MAIEPLDNQSKDFSFHGDLPTSPNFLERHNLTPVGFAVISLVVVFFLYQIIGGTISFLLFGGKVRSEDVQWIRLSTVVSQLLLILVPTLVLARLQTTNLMEGLRLRATGSREIFFAVIGVISLQQILQVYLYAQDQIPLPPSVRPILESIRRLIEETYRSLVTAHSIPELVYVVLVVAMVPAFCEEMLFRGLVQKNFEQGVKTWRGIVLTGVIFGAYHFNPFSFIPLAILGIYFGFLVYQSQSILTSIVAHFANNLFAVLAVFFNADEGLLLSEPASLIPVETLLLTAGGFGVLFIFSTYAFVRITRQASESVME